MIPNKKRMREMMAKAQTQEAVNHVEEAKMLLAREQQTRIEAASAALQKVCDEYHVAVEGVCVITSQGVQTSVRVVPKPQT
jgi:tagatose-1,6-bisphosphate aldolase